MHTYALTKSGTILVVWSENTKEQTLEVYSLALVDKFDSNVHPVQTIQYSSIRVTDTNLGYLKSIQHQ
jgi:hypothetical protein